MTRHHGKTLAKVLMAALGTAPDLFGVVLDDDGWLDLKELHLALKEEPALAWLTPRALGQILAHEGAGLVETDGGRARLLTSRQRIKPMATEPCPAPEILYACTRKRAYNHVSAHGLEPSGAKPWVVLARTAEMALRIGRRRDAEPVLVEIMTSRAQTAGLLFYPYGESLFLARGTIERQWLRLPPPPRVKREQTDRPQKPAGNAASDPAQSGVFTPRIEHVLPAPGPTHFKKDRRDREPSWKEARRSSRRS